MVVPSKVCTYYLVILKKLYSFSNALLAYEFLLSTIFAAFPLPFITATSGLAKIELREREEGKYKLFLFGLLLLLNTFT